VDNPAAAGQAGEDGVEGAAERVERHLGSRVAEADRAQGLGNADEATRRSMVERSRSAIIAP
jgi:hypothetical protein